MFLINNLQYHVFVCACVGHKNRITYSKMVNLQDLDHSSTLIQSYSFPQRHFSFSHYIHLFPVVHFLKSEICCSCFVAKSFLTHCNPMDCSPPGSSVHGISLARILEWVAISSSRGSSRPRDWTQVSCGSCIGRQVLYHQATWEVSCFGFLGSVTRGEPAPPALKAES